MSKNNKDNKSPNNNNNKKQQVDESLKKRDEEEEVTLPNKNILIKNNSSDDDKSAPFDIGVNLSDKQFLPSLSGVSTPTIDYLDKITGKINSIENSSADYQKLLTFVHDGVNAGTYNPFRKNNLSQNQDINIEDSNRPRISTAPTIDSSFGNVISETGLTESDVVATFTASDIDGNAVRFLITSGNEEKYFKIAPFTGNITLTPEGIVAIDNDTLNLTELNLGVTATDGARNSNESIISVNINRVNDNAPTIDTAIGNTVTKELISTATVVANFTNSDIDVDDNTTYTITPGSNNESYFSINANGEVTLSATGIAAVNSDTGIDLTGLVVD
ncbi:MAG: hypothetical protein ACI9IL_001050, partial [Rickettsiales bacterium]